MAHDSHNIIVVGTNDDDMAFAVEQLMKQDGGIILVKDQKILESMPMPIAGLMSDQSGEWINEKLTQIHKTAHDDLKINKDVETSDDTLLHVFSSDTRKLSLLIWDCLM